MVENEFLREAFVKVRFSADCWIDKQAEAIPVRGRRDWSGSLDQRTTSNERTDLFAEAGFYLPLANHREYRFRVPRQIALQVLVFRPTFHPFESKETGVYAVDQIIEAIGRVIGPVHDLALQTPEMI